MTQLVVTNFHASQGRQHTQEPGEGGLHPSHPFNVPSLCAHFFFSLSLNRLEKGVFFKTIDLDATDGCWLPVSLPEFPGPAVVTLPSTVVQGVTCLAAPLS